MSGKPTKNAGTSIVVIVNNLCPATDPNPLCSQPDLKTANQYGGVVDFNLCNDDMAHAALLGDAGTGLAVGNATQVDCSEWSGTKKTDCGSDCSSTAGGATVTVTATAGQIGGTAPASTGSGSGQAVGETVGGAGNSLTACMWALLFPFVLMLRL
jgi:hypothetical protein